MKKLLHRDWLDSHINLEVQAGKVSGISLDKAKQLAELLGNPQKNYPALHLTGTNGKGSTAHILTHLLMVLGYRVGTYASPHTVSLNERLQLDGNPISDTELDEALEYLVEVEEKTEVRFSWFELMTTAAFFWFSQKEVDVAVVEVGKLGRFDATNIVDAEVCIVTNISKDHTDGSDGWEKAIAWEKAGIIKPNSTLIANVSQPELRQVLDKEMPKASYYLGQDLKCLRNEPAQGGRDLNISLNISSGGDNTEYKDIFLSMHGQHQGTNATLALAAAQVFLDSQNSSDALTTELVGQAFSSVNFPCRFEVLSDDPLLIVDGGHNPEGVSAARKTLDDFLISQNIATSTLIVGMTDEKSAEDMLLALRAETFSQIICTEIPTPRTKSAQELHEVAKQIGVNSIAIPDTEEVLAAALSSDLVFVCGSLYLAGVIKRKFNELGAEGINFVKEKVSR